MGYDVQITRLPLQALFDLKGTAAGLKAWAGSHLPPLPARPNGYEALAGRMLKLIGPDHWILRAGIDEEDALLAALNPDGAPTGLSIVRISDSLVFFSITGPDADQVMAVATPLDFTALAPSDVTVTEALGIKALIRRIPDGYEMAVDLSFAPMVQEYLNRIRS